MRCRGAARWAVLVGALLEWQVSPQWEFAAPMMIVRQLGREDLDAQVSAECDPGRLAELFAARPAVRHCPQLMARQVRDLCRFLVARHGGVVVAVWTGL